MDLTAPERIAAMGYRGYVGGEDPEMWYGIGRLQYHFLTSEGLSPEHVFVDLACGALRLGQFLIPYLRPGHYWGIDGEESLIKSGLDNEFNFDVIAQRRPNFIITYDFDLDSVGSFDYAMAQSLFTHLTLSDIGRAFAALARIARPHSRFYFTFFEGDSSSNPTHSSHANKAWRYNIEELRSAAEST